MVQAPSPQLHGLSLSQAINVDNRYVGPIDPIREESISLIIPVKDNQYGLERLLDALLSPGMHSRPLEIIVVDNNSVRPIWIPDHHADKGVPIVLLTCTKPGAGAARNTGAAAAKGNWLLFTDSDCVPSPGFLRGYLSTSSQAIAYAGHVKGVPDTSLARFYDAEGTLLPKLKVDAAGDSMPLYLVTANALVWRWAFEACGGFNEEFNDAGGEDVDLSIRLWQVGRIERALDSVVMHDFSDGVVGLWRRFRRYGTGDSVLQSVAGLTMRPRWKPPTNPSPYTFWLKGIQHGALCYGYYRTRIMKSFTT
jgi:glycosyltransferase involved in cell wall biosynthesis